MIERKDLTRWNRASLTSFRYVDGKAAEYLEILREQLFDKFKDPETERVEWLSPAEEIPVNEKEPEDNTETLSQLQARLSIKRKRILEMYRQDRRDWIWEITRTFSRACHILTEHINAYANEGYLNTASQWDNVRKLVEMIDYHPAPPASASTMLVLEAKEKKQGMVSKGFQIKHSPEDGSPKIIFETLEDIFIDYTLNELRPKDADKSYEPLVNSENDDAENAKLQDENAQQTTQEAKGSSPKILNESVIILQNIGKKRLKELSRLKSNSEEIKIKDLLDLNLKNLPLKINIHEPWLKEFQAKARRIAEFQLEKGWEELKDWLLPKIASEEPDILMNKTGYNRDQVKRMKQELENLEAVLDHPAFRNTALGDLFVSKIKTDTVKKIKSVMSPWKIPRKPKVNTEDVALIYREYRDSNQINDTAQAATVYSIDKNSGAIHLLLDQIPEPGTESWTTWPKSEVTLHVTPRWKRKCWLNGDNVIRTAKPHGLTGNPDDNSPGTYIGWKDGGFWKYAKITETDKRNLRLDYKGTLPEKDTPLYLLTPIYDLKVPKEFEVIVLLGTEEEGGDILDTETNPIVKNVSPEINKSPFDEIFKINNDAVDAIGGGGGGFLPPGGLPKIGSFLFPTPMLPVDLVKAAADLMLNLGVMQIPSSGDIVIKGLPFEGALAGISDINDLAASLYTILDGMKAVDSDGNSLSPEKNLVAWEPNPDGSSKSPDEIKADLAAVLSRAEDGPSPLFQEIVEGLERSGPLLGIKKDTPEKAVVDSGSPHYVVEGSIEKITGGDWIVGRFTSGLKALKISAVEEFTDGAVSLSFEESTGNKELKNIYADFQGILIAEDAAINKAPVDPEGIELEEIPESLKTGRDVLLTAKGKDPVPAKIESINGSIITTNPPATGFIKGNLIIYGNVVPAGHGEKMPEKILGSGNASKTSQEFTLEVDGLSFTPDSTKSSGVAAAIDVEVSGRVWQQVSALKDSAPDDPYYAIQMTEEGYVKIVFGDGEHGRRLPTGKNNIRIRYRTGSGLAGNVPAHSLEKPVNPHRLVEAVKQPVPAAGGGDMEDVTSLRENAPSTLLALERAVSLSDFSHLAASQSSVWQARAFSQVVNTGRTEIVKVVIVPAGGIESPELEKFTQLFLQNHSQLGVQVIVENFSPVYFSLKVKIRVKTNEFLIEDVKRTVTSSLIDHFALKNRKLGEHLYLSEVYKIVEGVKGVENSKCEIYKPFPKNIEEQDNQTIEVVTAHLESRETEEVQISQVIKADDDKSVVYLDLDADSTLEVIHEEYEL